MKLSVTLDNDFCPLTNITKNYIFKFSGGPGYASVRVVLFIPLTHHDKIYLKSFDSTERLYSFPPE